MTKRKNLSPTEEPLIIQQLLIGLRYHIQTQSLLSSQKAKQRIVVWIAVVATVLTSIFAIAR
ncbi:hypothetical protein GCM10011386_14390 [Parapedobacter defluvii]|uniref:Uncharacterized protein n=1 Tax=Parapedobacter defluvii TaxID=2045106 RepID=A0ABQ1LGT1_9SPHI|nr:hypothetical protein [Parapedobacter defluvii]GGC23578.1 hypothetical protein GCM10011386_14390 [Parapedobacter defluvii]